MIEGLIAFVFSLASVIVIYWSWRRPGRTVIALIGWLLALASVIIWIRALGPEFGVTYSTIVFVCLIWLGVILNRLSSQSKEKMQNADQTPLRPYQALTLPTLSSQLKHGSLFLLSVPLSGLLTMMLSVALVLYLPWTMLHKVTAAIFLYPVLWGALSAWICAQKNPLRPALASAGLLVISSFLLFV
ncbi:MAG: hypothetical protein COA96_11970 [SAR86 cluster bacterium]|uniref:Uncharacterized protein n=1 Tax=SAR86 cluster bacterium TaxID=2030880 RepID=A0A2A5AVN5_9GAMM|nr:MAG: hypothetical protein COA96_11970 [SAR86 cluster bacterium]